MKAKFVKNLSITGLSMIYTQGAQVLLLLIMARWLSPEEFGVFALISVVLNFSVLMGEFGIGAYVIYVKKITEETLGTCLLVNLILSVFLSSVLLCFSESISTYFNIEDSNLLRLTSFSILISTLGVVHKSLLEKELRFQEIAKIEIFSTTVSILIAVFIAIRGGGVYSLVIQFMLKLGLSSIGYMISSSCRYNLIFNFSNEALKGILSYSSYLMMNNVVNQMSRSADQLIIGKKLSFDSLGYYSMAYKIVLFPVQRINAIVNRVNFPTLAKVIEDKKEFEKHFCNSTIMTCYLTFPALIFILFYSQELVAIFFDESWSIINEFIPILIPIGIIQTVLSNVSSLYLVRNKTKIGFFIQCFSTVVMICAFLLGAEYGPKGVLWCYLFANIIVFFPGFIIPLAFSFISVHKVLIRVFFILVFYLILIMIFELATSRLIPMTVNEKLMLGGGALCCFYILGFKVKRRVLL